MGSQAGTVDVFSEEANCYELTFNVVAASEPGKVFRTGLIEFLPGFETPEAACRMSRGIWRRWTKLASATRPVVYQGVRCPEQVALDITRILKATSSECREHLNDIGAAMQPGGPSPEQSRRARRLKPFKVIR
jgi:hypothetical protein